jgi:hypothetical protein
VTDFADAGLSFVNGLETIMKLGSFGKIGARRNLLTKMPAEFTFRDATS